MKHVGKARHVDRHHHEPGAKRERAPYPWIACDFIAEEARGLMTHIEDVPELREGEGQERDGYRRSLIQPEPEMSQRQRSQRSRRSARLRAER